MSFYLQILRILPIVFKIKKIAIFTIFLLLIVITLSISFAVRTSNFESRSKAVIEKKANHDKFKGQKTTPEILGYLVEFHTPPVSKFRNNQSQLPNTSSSLKNEIGNYRIRLYSEHVKNKESIAKILGLSTSEFAKLQIGEYTDVFNGLALNINASSKDTLQKLPFVKRIYENKQLKPLLSESVPLIQANKVWEIEDEKGNFITGKDVNIAIIDTGIDYTHPDLGGTRIEEHLFDQIAPENTSDRFSLNHNRIVYAQYSFAKARYNMVLKNLTTGESEEILPPDPSIWPIYVYLQDTILAYVALDEASSSISRFYYYDIATKQHIKIDDMWDFSSVDICSGKIFYTRYLGAGTADVVEYDITTAQKNVLYTDSQPLLSFLACDGDTLAYTKTFIQNPNDDRLVIYNIKTGKTKEYAPPDMHPGFLLDLKNTKVLYPPFPNTEHISRYYYYDFVSGENTIIEYQDPFAASAGDSRSDTFTPKPLSPDSEVLKEGPPIGGKIGDGMIFIHRNVVQDQIAVYDMTAQRTVLINPKTLSYTFDVEGKKVCFSTIFQGIYCHTYDPSYPYTVNTDIFNSKVVGGYDYGDDDKNPYDINGHGTHVAAIAGGNGTLKGVAPDSRLWAYKVAGYGGSIYGSWIISAFESIYKTHFDNDSTNDIAIVNVSLGASCGAQLSYNCGPDDPLSQSVDHLTSENIVVVVAAGNDGEHGDKTINSPATAREALAVGAIDKQKIIAGWSSKGPVVWNNETIYKPDVVAPGVDICAAEYGGYHSDLRCLDTTHVRLGGTSMASPHVAGTVALFHQAFPSYTALQIKNLIKDNADTLGLPANTQGAGLVNAFKPFNDTVTPVPSRIIPSVTPSPLLNNGSFQYDRNGDNLPDDWTGKNLDKYDMIVVYTDTTGLSQRAFQFHRPAESQKRVIKQKISYPTGTLDERVILTGKTDLNKNNIRGNAGMILKIYNKKGKLVGSTSSYFDGKSHDWQNEKKLVLRAREPYDRIEVVLFATNLNTRYRLDNFSLKVVNKKDSSEETSPSALSVDEINNTE